ncbi:helix-turn-helix domain-containing protein [Brevibacillus borstelensis]
MKAKVIETVKTAMKSKGVTKSNLAKQIGCSYQHIHDLLSGRRRWNEDYIESVCNALGITIAFDIEEVEEEAVQ